MSSRLFSETLKSVTIGIQHLIDGIRLKSENPSETTRIQSKHHLVFKRDVKTIDFFL